MRVGPMEFLLPSRKNELCLHGTVGKIAAVKPVYPSHMISNTDVSISHAVCMTTSSDPAVEGTVWSIRL
jgi:hypothetical protein